YGDGSQTRSFCYVSDEFEGIYRLMMSDYALPVNIGNPEEHTILEFAEIILRMSEAGRRLFLRSYRWMTRSRGDRISRRREGCLGGNPRFHWSGG
ncbi:MAG: SDR family NAD-dependent epimerase/dehydratase, partial [Euryarchaeota archaeon]|nr:SDR family NAD-dependent epimerase/dehydratase [Euryarchaeota archaeon]